MNAAYLSDGELSYEMHIRNLIDKGTVEDNRRSLRHRLRDEAKGTANPPRTFNDQIDVEFAECEKKYKYLTSIPIIERKKQGKCINTKVVHLQFRLERLNNTIPIHSPWKSNIAFMLDQIRSLIDPQFLVSEPEISDDQQVYDTQKNINSDKIITDGMSELTVRAVDTISSNLNIYQEIGGKTRKKKTTELLSGGNISFSDSDSEVGYETQLRESLADPPAGRSTGIPRLDRSRSLKRICPIYRWKILFSGDSKGLTLNDFLQQIEMQAATEEVSDRELFLAAYYFFEGPAKTWFRAFRSKFNSWNQLVLALKKEFLPSDHDYWLAREIDQRMQGRDESFSLYLAQMKLYYQSLIEPIPEKDQLPTIIRNLQPFYLEKLPIVGVKTIDQLSLYCKRIEDLRYNLNRRSTSNRSILEPSLNRGFKIPRVNAFVKDSVEDTKLLNSQDQAVSVSTINASPATRVKCWNCSEAGHTFNNCLKEKTKLFCFKCGMTGFVTRKCPKCGPSVSENQK